MSRFTTLLDKKSHGHLACCLLQPISVAILAWISLQAHSAIAEPVKSPSRAAMLLQRLYDGRSSDVMVAAHRGDWRNEPENSLPAISRCIELGVDIVEIDIQITRDEHLILMHDKTLDRTTTGTGKVRNHTLAEIKTLRLKNGYGLPTDHGVPTLAEAFEIANNKILIYVDKSPELISAVDAVARRTGTSDQVLYYGHYTPAELRDSFPNVVDQIHYLPKLGDKTSDAGRYVDGFMSGRRVPAFVVSFTDEHSPVVSQMADIRRRGTRIWASSLWDDLCAGHTDDRAQIDPETNWGWLVKKGANIICTDRPIELLEYLRRKNLHE